MTRPTSPENQAPYGSGIYRRELHVRLAPGRAEGELIDDFHHFLVVVHHDGTRVTEVEGEVVRQPWETCAGALIALGALRGMPLEGSLRAAGRYTPARFQCTHQFDAAALAIARAGRDAGDVVYRIEIPDRVEDRSRATLERDGQLVLDWEVGTFEILGPEPFAGRALFGGAMAPWIERSFDVERAEAALLLHRASVISMGRQMNLDTVQFAGELELKPIDACHTFQTGRYERAARVRGSGRNYTAVPDLLAASRSEPESSG